LSATDWVKNGDRWIISHISRQGELTVRHTRSQLITRLPADYARASTGLGYASTIHSAQGITADTMHSLLTGQESRQQLYTMLTRGRHANHLYLQVVGDGDPHTVIRPDTISSRTPTETLQQIIARDEAPVSASTLLRELKHPAARLFDAVQRYTDSLNYAAEQAIGRQAVADLDHIDQHISGLTAEPAWPTLRAHLLDLAAETVDQHISGLTAEPAWPAPTSLPSPPKPATTPTATSKKPRMDVTCPPPTIWPPSSTGDFPTSPHNGRAHCRGYLEFLRTFKITRSGEATSPTGASSSPSLPTSSKNKPPWPTPIPTGRHSTAISETNFSGRSPSGGPQTGSTLATRPRPVPGDSKGCHPAGRTNLTAPSPVR
jgi:hypothetical protein